LETGAIDIEDFVSTPSADADPAFVRLIFVRPEEARRVPGFGEAAFGVGLDSGFASLVLRLNEVLLDLGFTGVAPFVDATASLAPSLFVLLKEALVVLGLAETDFLPAAICDVKSLTAASALSSFLRVFDSFAFSFFFFIFS